MILDFDKIYEDINKFLIVSSVDRYISLKNLTYYKVGGDANIVVNISSEDELKSLLLYINDYNKKISDKENILKYYILGNGTNVLADDKGFNGIIILIKDLLNDISLVYDNIIRVSAGASLKDLSEFALNNSLSGLEFAQGIPGGVGAAVSINAGAYDGEIKNFLISARAMNELGEIKEYNSSELNLSYRSSKISKENLIVLSAKFLLKKADYNLIKEKMDDFRQRRISKQPLNYPSCGSVFKRPEGDYAGRLIETSNLKGLKFNNAQISNKHANFIINLSNAKSEDIKTLIKMVQNEVYYRHKILLEREVRFI